MMKGIFLTATVVLALSLTSADAAAQAKPVQIGIATTFLNGRSKSVVEIAADDFKGVLKKIADLDGELLSHYDATEIALKLKNKQLDLGIFHGHEFAWMQKKYPELLPLMIAVNKHREDRACVIVHKDSPAKSVADLRGKKIDMPADVSEISRVFLQKYTTPMANQGLDAFFGAIVNSSSPTAALDDVARRKVDAAIVGTIGLEFYKEVKGPVFEKNLKILQQSASFPPVVIVYRPGKLEETTLNQFRDGLLRAHKSDEGRDMMKTWNIETFELIPKDYNKSLAEVLKAYPPPVLLR